MYSLIFFIKNFIFQTMYKIFIFFIFFTANVCAQDKNQSVISDLSGTWHLSFKMFVDGEQSIVDELYPNEQTFVTFELCDSTVGEWCSVIFLHTWEKQTKEEAKNETTYKKYKIVDEGKFILFDDNRKFKITKRKNGQIRLFRTEKKGSNVYQYKETLTKIK